MDKQFPLGKQQRVRRQADFDRIYAGDAFAADDVLVVRGVRNELGKTRLGLSISRKVGNAVVRNRWKRLIREAFRLSQGELPTGIDVVVRPRRGAVPDFKAIRGSLPRMLRKVHQRLGKR